VNASEVPTGRTSWRQAGRETGRRTRPARVSLVPGEGHDLGDFDLLVLFARDELDVGNPRVEQHLNAVAAEVFEDPALTARDERSRFGRLQARLSQVMGLVAVFVLARGVRVADLGH